MRPRLSKGKGSRLSKEKRTQVQEREEDLGSAEGMESRLSKAEQETRFPRL